MSEPRVTSPSQLQDATWPPSEGAVQQHRRSRSTEEDEEDSLGAALEVPCESSAAAPGASSEASGVAQQGVAPPPSPAEFGLEHEIRASTDGADGIIDIRASSHKETTVNGGGRIGGSLTSTTVEQGALDAAVSTAGTSAVYSETAMAEKPASMSYGASGLFWTSVGTPRQAPGGHLGTSAPASLGALYPRPSAAANDNGNTVARLGNSSVLGSRGGAGQQPPSVVSWKRPLPSAAAAASGGADGISSASGGGGSSGVDGGGGTMSPSRRCREETETDSVLDAAFAKLARVIGVQNPKTDPPASELMSVSIQTREQRLEWRDFLCEAVSKSCANALFVSYDVEAEPPPFAKPQLSAPCEKKSPLWLAARPSRFALPLPDIVAPHGAGLAGPSSSFKKAAALQQDGSSHRLGPPRSPCRSSVGLATTPVGDEQQLLSFSSGSESAASRGAAPRSDAAPDPCERLPVAVSMSPRLSKQQRAAARDQPSSQLTSPETGRVVVKGPSLVVQQSVLPGRPAAAPVSPKREGGLTPLVQMADAASSRSKVASSPAPAEVAASRRQAAAAEAAAEGGGAVQAGQAAACQEEKAALQQDVAGSAPSGLPCGGERLEDLFLGPPVCATRSQLSAERLEDASADEEAALPAGSCPEDEADGVSSSDEEGSPEPEATLPAAPAPETTPLVRAVVQSKRETTPLSSASESLIAPAQLQAPSEAVGSSGNSDAMTETARMHAASEEAAGGGNSAATTKNDSAAAPAADSAAETKGDSAAVATIAAPRAAGKAADVADNADGGLACLCCDGLRVLLLNFSAAQPGKRLAAGKKRRLPAAAEGEAPEASNSQAAQPERLSGCPSQEAEAVGKYEMAI
eukprot:TRINITY_DN26173_c1_g1_i2.p1 TRINITY_DN26173_c1_g1~~TRINITY_DN26173_c1_g1_i2.p1  ORF type:complete len:862 (-),score=227.72 TRINITY_DN26173_c1_g1_i2:659-3244(-)